MDRIDPGSGTTASNPVKFYRSQGPGKRWKSSGFTINKEKSLMALQQTVDLRYWDERRGSGKGGLEKKISEDMAALKKKLA